MYKKWMNGFVICLLTGIVLINFLYLKEERRELSKIGENLIRFHVLANSDSPEDQELKLKVRDKIIHTMADELEKSTDIDETRKILRENLSKIEAVAEEEIKSNVENYFVTASLEDSIFPTKRYGNVVFPAGIYEALRIEIGEAKGDRKSVV